MDWYRITCWRCSGNFMDIAPGGDYCIWCAAPCFGERDGQFVRHVSVLVGPLPEPAPPPPPVASAWDEDGVLPIYQWRLRTSTTGRLYTTRHKLTARTARGIDPDAVPASRRSSNRAVARPTPATSWGGQR
jgi:hypothetical protein